MAIQEKLTITMATCFCTAVENTKGVFPVEQMPIIAETDWGIRVVMNHEIIDRSNLLSTIKYIFGFCKEKGENKILIDATSYTRNVSVVNFYYGIELMQQLGPLLVKMAVIAPHLVDNDESRFVENAGFNKSIYIQYFPNEQDALDWLLKEN